MLSQLAFEADSWRFRERRMALLYSSRTPEELIFATPAHPRLQQLAANGFWGGRIRVVLRSSRQQGDGVGKGRIDANTIGAALRLLFSADMARLVASVQQPSAPTLPMMGGIGKQGMMQVRGSSDFNNLAILATPTAPTTSSV